MSTHGKGGHGVRPSQAAPASGDAAPFVADTPASRRLFRASVAGFLGFTAYVGLTAYNGYYSEQGKAAAEAAVAALPLLKGNPVVFLDFAVDNVPVGRVVIQLRKDVAPVASGACA
jgi:hypothetical protein